MILENINFYRYEDLSEGGKNATAECWEDKEKYKYKIGK